MGEARPSRPIPHLPLPHPHATFPSFVDKAQDPIPNSPLLLSGPDRTKTVSKIQDSFKDHEKRELCREKRAFPTQVLSVACRQDSNPPITGLRARDPWQLQHYFRPWCLYKKGGGGSVLFCYSSNALFGFKVHIAMMSHIRNMLYGLVNVFPDSLI